jgi:phytoene/squalene synthetase
MEDLDERRLTEPWQRVLRRMAARTRESFQAGRAVCDGVRGRLRHELRFTWLGGMQILDRLEKADYNVFAGRPALGVADAPTIVWRAIWWGSRP